MHKYDAVRRSQRGVKMEAQISNDVQIPDYRCPVVSSKAA